MGRLLLGMVLFAVYMTLTAGATVAGGMGLGIDGDLRRQVSLRNGSVPGGRVYVGGGLHGGK